MNIKMIGKITRIFPLDQRGNFRKRIFDIVTETQIQTKKGTELKKNDYGLVTFYNDCYQLNDYSPGDSVEVEIEIQSKTWKGSYITNLVAQKITRIDSKGTQAEKERKEKLKEFRRNPPPIIKAGIYDKK